MSRIYGLAHALLVHLKDDPLFRITIPSKTQACMATGIPILMAMRGDAADLVRQSGGGVLCDPEDPEAMAAAAETLSALTEAELHDMGRRAKDYYYERLSFSHGVGQFLQAMETSPNRASAGG
jgi:glycosyltransferase involved in cell wall biosynthesis